MSTNNPDFFQAPQFSPEAFQPPKQRGCFFYGCIIASVLAALIAVLIVVVGVVAYRFMSQMVQDYTATAPRELPKLELSSEGREAVKTRFNAFRSAVKAGEPTEPLVLSSDDLNALIEENPDFKGKIFATIENDVVKGQVSIPLDALVLPLFKGRYLNGEAEFKVSLESGVLIVTLDSIEVNGKRPPEQMLTKLRRQNFAKDLTKDTDNAEMIRKLDSIQIKDGKIIIKARAKKPRDDSKKDAKKKDAEDYEDMGDEPAQAKDAKPAPAPNPAPKNGAAPAAATPKSAAPVEIKIEPPAAATPKT